MKILVSPCLEFESWIFFQLNQQTSYSFIFHKYLLRGYQMSEVLPGSAFLVVNRTVKAPGFTKENSDVDGWEGRGQESGLGRGHQTSRQLLIWG